MITKIAICLLAASLFTACATSPNSTAQRQQTLESRMMAQNSANPNGLTDPLPPAQGPEDVPASGTIDPTRNPSLLPTPLLRTSAASGL